MTRPTLAEAGITAVAIHEKDSAVPGITYSWAECLTCGWTTRGAVEINDNPKTVRRAKRHRCPAKKTTD